MNSTNFKTAQNELTELTKSIENDLALLKYDLVEGRMNKAQAISSLGLNVAYNLSLVCEDYALTDHEVNKLNCLADVHTKELEHKFLA